MKKIIVTLAVVTLGMSGFAQGVKLHRTSTGNPPTFQNGKIFIDTAAGKVKVGIAGVYVPLLDSISYGNVIGSAAFINDADYSIAAGVGIVVYTNMSADRTLTLPSAAANAGRRLTIKHGGAGAFLINFSVNLRENASTTFASIGNNQWVSMISDGTDWYVYAMK